MVSKVVDVTEISAVVAAAGVLVGVLYYILDMRNQTRQRQTDMLWNIYRSMVTKEFLEAMLRIMTLEFKDYDDFVKRYGPMISESPITLAYLIITDMYEGIGVLLHRKLVEADLLFEFVSVQDVWEKTKPLIEENRKQFNSPRTLEWFEYLYNESRKREQRK